MPNWCSNELRISTQNDTPEAAEQFAEISTAVKSVCESNAEQGLFNLTLPRPEILANTISGFSPEMETDAYKAQEAEAIKQTGHKNWHDWCCAVWGTKWDACHLAIQEEDEDTIEVHFETAWCPPEAWLAAMREKYSNLTFSLFFREDGMQMAGWL